MPNTEDHEVRVLKKAYDGLRIANENLHDVRRDIFRLTEAKDCIFPDASRPWHHLRHDRDVWDRQFENEDSSEWWSRARRSGLIDSEASIDQELQRLSVSKKNSEDVQGALRCCINKISRPHLRDLHILDVPNEILLKIFEFVEGFDYDSESYRWAMCRKYIQNCRLTCRRFCSVSSHMLIRLVRVDLRASSLSRLEEISRHPTISKGVRAVLVVLQSYNQMLSTHIENFVRYHVGKLEERVDLFERARLWEVAEMSEESGLAVAGKAGAVLASWRRLASPGGTNDAPGGTNDDEEDNVNRALLEATYEDYQRLYKEQESMRGRGAGTFAQVVGSSMARMPCARKLEFRDSDSGGLIGRSLIVSGGDVCGAIYRDMLEPTTGLETEDHGLEPLRYEVIPELLGALRCAGVWLDSIEIELAFLVDYQQLVPDPETREKLSSSMQQLRTFSFRCDGGIDEQDSDNINELLKPCLDTPSLRKLSLDLRSDSAEDNWAVHRLCRAVISRPRLNLTDIFLAGIALDLSDLVLFLKTLQPSLSRIDLHSVHLLNGTWAEALEALREKSYRFNRLDHLRGAEWDDLSDEELAKVFGPFEDGGYRHYGISQAERYVRKMTTCNPLLALET
ncbi:hypothetical protein C8A00DRAFT_35148 [Chaetomidium leptoderma]|uniref:F-box domain-containing protein n=1 Tax=Chaetomidium leptoderma TaxID=669021 RepID=A0AAN6VJC7_9PEZI|nr:hypothetical protein C8A00DRAFT_35148 [Chaetomidium leptoderma]